MIVADGTNFHVGWIESRHGIFNFSVAFGATGAADLRSLKVDSHLSRLIHDSNNGVQIQDRLSKARTGQEFASIFQDVVNEINHESTLPDISFSSELIISHLEFIGWKRVVRVNSDFSKIKLVTWDCCGRSHTFDLELGGNYPTVPPTIHISLPEPVVLKWTNRSNLATVLSDVDDSITKYQELFQVSWLNVTHFTVDILSTVPLVVNGRFCVTLMSTSTFWNHSSLLSPHQQDGSQLNVHAQLLLILTQRTHQV